MYDKGQGFLQDHILSHMWFNIVSSLGDTWEAVGRDNVEKKMTPAQVAEAQKLARQCVKKKYKGC